MPSEKTQTPHDLGDFAEFLRQLEEEGFEYAVIGGMAVAAYAHLIGEAVLSVDLDILVTQGTLADLLEWAPRRGIRVIKRPKPRNIPVAFLETDGKEVNVLTSSDGLRDPEVVTRAARPFSLRDHGDVEVPVADPFDLLANKLAVARDKDRPHAAILRRFVEEEVAAAFHDETKPRARLAPARRLLEVLDSRALPQDLASRLVELARTPVDFRFLANHVPTRDQASRLLERVEQREEELARQLESIVARRRFQ